MPVTYLFPTSNASKELSDPDYDLLSSMIDSMDEDVDSWCTSSIACCDNCFDEYSRKWPLAYTRAHGIRYQNTPARLFYASAGRVQGTVTESEFLRLLPYIACPNCGGSLGPNLFAFELPFDPADFEADLERLAELAKTAPFLVLSDEFARRIRDEITAFCLVTEQALPTGEFFRGRDVDASSAASSDFGAPPASKTKEGRYNHAGSPVLYLADTYETCWEECRRPSDPFSIGILEFTKPVKILDLSEPDEMKGVLAPVMYSNLTAAPSEGGGWDRPEYVLTRFVADCARLAGMDGIRYRSTRTGKGTNTMLLKGEAAMDYIRVVRVEKPVAPSRA